MSDFRAAIYTNFINRRTGKEISQIPVMNRLTVNKDIRQLCDTFDFDVTYRFDESIDLHSHDFVEFYFVLDNARFQIGCGFIEDFVSETNSSQLRFQANGRDFLGQLFNLPFMKASPFAQTNILSLVKTCIAGGYLPEYLKFRGITRAVVDAGAYGGTLLVPELTDSKIAPLLQQTADEVYNCVYQNRFGQAVVWGRSKLDEMTVDQEIHDVRDQNVSSFLLRENFSKVFSECKVFYTGGENNVDYAHTPSQTIANLDKKARQIYQPEIRTFQTGTLVTTAGQISLGDKKDQYAASILRKSNQNLTQVVIRTTLPFYVTASGAKIPYEVNQLWPIVSTKHRLNEKMRLAGICYTQTDSALDVQLLFIPRDSLV